MNKAMPYIYTIGTKEYKNFVLQTFNIELIQTLFVGWKLIKDENNIKLINEKGTILLTFHPQLYIFVYYRIDFMEKTQYYYDLSVPKTLNDFISDLHRCNLIWNDEALKNLTPKDYLPENDVESFYRKSLNEIEKNNEII